MSIYSVFILLAILSYSSGQPVDKKPESTNVVEGNGAENAVDKKPESTNVVEGIGEGNAVDKKPESLNVVEQNGVVGPVNLIEFNIKGTLFGKCTYTFEGKPITLTYEENGDKMVAKSSDPNTPDPAGKAEICRELASKKPPTPNESRVALSPEAEQELVNQLKEYENAIIENQEFTDDLKPKIFSVLSTLMSSGWSGLSFGTTGGSGINIGLPSFADKNSFGATFGGPFNWFGRR